MISHLQNAIKRGIQGAQGGNVKEQFRVPERQFCLLGLRRHSGAKKLFVILHGKRKAELVPTW